MRSQPKQNTHHYCLAKKITFIPAQSTDLTSKTRNTHTLNTCEIPIVPSSPLFHTKKLGLNKKNHLAQKYRTNGRIRLKIHTCLSSNKVLDHCNRRPETLNLCGLEHMPPGSPVSASPQPCLCLLNSSFEAFLWSPCPWFSRVSGMM